MRTKLKFETIDGRSFPTAQEAATAFRIPLMQLYRARQRGYFPFTNKPYPRRKTAAERAAIKLAQEAARQRRDRKKAAEIAPIASYAEETNQEVKRALIDARVKAKAPLPFKNQFRPIRQKDDTVIYVARSLPLNGEPLLPNGDTIITKRQWEALS